MVTVTAALFFALLNSSVAPGPLDDCVPARWPWADVQSLELLSGTPVNCLLLERPQWSPEFSRAAAAAGVRLLGVVRPGEAVPEAVATAEKSGLRGLVLEGDFLPAAVSAARRNMPVVLLAVRSRLRSAPSADALGTTEAVWPGIRVTDENGKAVASPSSVPWVDTNTGFLRFAGTTLDRVVWLGILPPRRRVLQSGDYEVAISDAAMGGGRWVIAFDDDLRTRLARRDPQAIATWRRICEYLRFVESAREWLRLPWAGDLLVVQGEAEGALLTGGLLDMIESRHTPLRVVPPERFDPSDLAGARIVVDMRGAPAATSGGPAVLSPPPGWRMPRQDGFLLDAAKLAKSDRDQMEAIWNGISFAAARRNLGVRVFNVGGMLSGLRVSSGGAHTVVVLVNYTGYPVESITVYFQKVMRRVRVLRPGEPPETLKIFAQDEADASGVDVARMGHLAILVAE